MWDTIEFDNAVQVALDFADKTNGDSDPANDTLVIVTADHETGGLGIIAVGNERYAPVPFGASVRDYAAVFRFLPAQTLNFYPNYEVDAKRLSGESGSVAQAAVRMGGGPDRFENWLSNRRMLDSSVRVSPDTATDAAGARRMSIANNQRDGTLPDSDNKSVDGQSRPGLPRQRHDRKRRPRLRAARPRARATRRPIRTSSAVTPAATSRSPRAARARSSSPARTTTPTSS